MEFIPIDKETWPRREYFDHYFSAVPCFYSMTTALDITRLRQEKVRLYPALLYLLTQTVNRHIPFRTAIRNGQLGYFDRMEPSYTVFSKETETFSSIWTLCQGDYATFLADYERDVAAYAASGKFSPKPNPPENLFNVSMIPWARFEGFHLDLPRGGEYLLPIFTLGQFYEKEGRWFIPLASQVHHAVCDGFHLCRFLDDLQAASQRAAGPVPVSGGDALFA